MNHEYLLSEVFETASVLTCWRLRILEAEIIVNYADYRIVLLVDGVD